MSQQVLDVFLHDKFVGKLSRENGRLSFHYNESYNTQPLSTSIPVQHEPFNHQLTHSFFSGLLPESQVRTRLARTLHISEENIFGLLEAIGGECAGAVSLYPEGKSPDTQHDHDYLVLDDDKAYAILSQLDKRPLMAGEDGIRISGAGAQDKLMIAFQNDHVAIPKYNTPSTHIIKPKIHDLDETVQNEFFCMTLAKKVGLDVPNANIYYLKNIPFYLVERYDREPLGHNDILRLHQEDFCQALHIPPELKYQSEGGPDLKECFDLLDHYIHQGLMAGVNKLRLIDGIIFNFLIGNGDAHGKNFSLLYKGEGAQVAPFYDLLCTRVYDDTIKSKMSMKLGGKYQFREVYMRHLEKFAEDIGVKPSLVKKRSLILAGKTYNEALTLMESLNQSPETKSPIYKEICQFIETHKEQLLF